MPCQGNSKNLQENLNIFHEIKGLIKKELVS